jgi:hypothetical protein
MRDDILKLVNNIRTSTNRGTLITYEDLLFQAIIISNSKVNYAVRKNVYTLRKRHETGVKFSTHYFCQAKNFNTEMSNLNINLVFD